MGSVYICADPLCFHAGHLEIPRSVLEDYAGEPVGVHGNGHPRPERYRAVYPSRCYRVFRE